MLKMHSRTFHCVKPYLRLVLHRDLLQFALMTDVCVVSLVQIDHVGDLKSKNPPANDLLRFAEHLGLW